MMLIHSKAGRRFSTSRVARRSVHAKISDANADRPKFGARCLLLAAIVATVGVPMSSAPVAEAATRALGIGRKCQLC
jgi:hypothetical protein